MRDVSRRSVAAWLGLTTTTATAAIANATAVSADQELLALGAKLTELEKELDEGERIRDAAIAHYDTTKPRTPEELIFVENRFANRSDKWMADFEYDSVHDSYTHDRALIFVSWRLQDGIKEIDKRSSRARYLRKLLQIAERYEEAREAAWRDYCGRVAGHALTCRRLNELVKQIAAITPKTIEGAVIKARAMLADARTEEKGSLDWSIRRMGASVASDLIRLHRAAA